MPTIMYAIPAKIAQFPPRFDDLDSAIMPPFRFFCEKLSEFKSNNVKSQLFDPELIDLQSLHPWLYELNSNREYEHLSPEDY